MQAKPPYDVTESDVTMLHNDAIDIEARTAKIAESYAIPVKGRVFEPNPR